MIMTETSFEFDKTSDSYMCHGEWTILDLGNILLKLKSSVRPKTKQVTINGSQISKFDSAGALTLLQCQKWLQESGITINLQDFTTAQCALLRLVAEKSKDLDYIPPVNKKRTLLYQIGKEAIHKISQANGFLVLIGDLIDKLFAACGNWHRFQLPSIISNMASTGLYALPIIGLLAFLIGVVLAYQMGLQLETYGATIFIAYLSGMAIFREFGPLITAIIVAGRTSSAFTAQIGSMKINEEIDALYTMGLSPTELLVVPKVIGLLIMFPLLIFWADFFGVLGAMIMSKFMLHVGYYDYLIRLQEAVGVEQLMLGLYKAPAFAILIALVGCFQGFQVQASADSIGSQTTRSVVQALFLIIIADATYSVIYSWLKL
ncbi:MAG: ABC transporter permease [Legionellales bacterium RIFCSPHIGHO2_12_FULL_35_11]|nr:MAG: ABC transporter permease [Legionellales bacterium RIFCSPHIGHO2_12_FULL_35_11]